MITAFGNGVVVGFSLIIAIGAQNAYVLRQGLRNEHIVPICLTCACSDTALICLGVTGFNTLVGQWPWLVQGVTALGAVFLLAYGARCFLSAWRAAALRPTDNPARGMAGAVATSMALTWLNPHVYLDTVFLIGSISTNFLDQKYWFAAGASAASFIFFFTLGLAARFLRPVLASPFAWRILDAIIGITMWGIAVSLLYR